MGKSDKKKSLNPADKARKEARKKELKKNKKQRSLVRTELLKNKDPYQILSDMERLDDMEYNINQPPSLCEKVLQGKRRKLDETWIRILAVYRKEQPEKYAELKRLEHDLNGRREMLFKQYQAVKSAQEVVLDEIPLPAGPVEEIPMPDIPQPSSKLNQPLGSRKIPGKSPPGCPPGIPPKLSELESELNELEKSKATVEATSTDDDLSKFLSEIDQVQKTSTVAIRPTGTSAQQLRSSVAVVKAAANQITPSSAAPSSTSLSSVMMASVNPTPNLLPYTPSAPSSISAPTPPLPPGQIPPLTAPPPAVPPRLPMMYLPQIAPYIRPPLQGAQIPAPSHLIEQGSTSMSTSPTTNRATSYATAGNTKQLHFQHQLNSGPTMGAVDNQRKSVFETIGKATIEAKPQLRNLSADATRFLPVSLRVKRTDNKPKIQIRPGIGLSSATSIKRPEQQQQQKQQSKDLAYEQFMKEMKDFM